MPLFFNFIDLLYLLPKIRAVPKWLILKISHRLKKKDVLKIINKTRSDCMKKPRIHKQFTAENLENKFSNLEFGYKKFIGGIQMVLFSDN